MQVIEESVRPESLQPLYIYEPDGRKVRDLAVPVDLTYAAFVNTILTYLDADTPTEPARTYKGWTEILRPINKEFDAGMSQALKPRLASNQKMSFSEFQKVLVTGLNSVRPLLNPKNLATRTATSELQFELNLNHPDVAKAMKRLTVPLSPKQRKTLTTKQLTDRQSAAAVLTPLAVIVGLKMLQDTIDHALDRADEIATSQLFAMRTHVAMSIQDMNVMFRDRMNQTFDKLKQTEQVAINAAVQLTNESLVAIDRLEAKGYLDASDLLCQSAVAMANFNLLPLFKRTPPPDIMCLKTPYVRDSGTLHERFLTFRGVSLRKGGDYPDAHLVVPTAEKNFNLPAGGGDTVLQIPLPGGINGGPDDIKPRGSLTALAEFNWNQGEGDKPKLKARWMFTIDPYLVNSLDVSVTPKIRQATYLNKSQQFYVQADGGETNTATWGIPVDNGGEAVDCWFVVNTKVGDSGVTNGPLRTPGGCEITAIARGPGHGQGGGSFGITLFIREKFLNEIAGPTWREIKHIVNQTQAEAVFTYDKTLIPQDSEVIDYDFDWRVDIHRNTEDQFTLTTSNKSDQRIGTATMDTNGNLTVKFNDPNIHSELREPASVDSKELDEGLSRIFVSDVLVEETNVKDAGRSLKAVLARTNR
jgi:hypothetical protein